MEIKNKLVIRRDKWGVGNKGGWLFNSKTGLSCCLGFFMRKIGYRNTKLEGNQSPEDVLSDFGIKDISGLEGLVTKKNGCNTAVCEELMETNDDKKLYYDERENRTSELFKRIGTEVKFVGKYKE